MNKLLFILLIIIIVALVYFFTYKLIDNFANNWFDKVDGIVYINLENREDRKKLILNELKRLETDMTKVNKVSGLYIPKNGHKGCVQSHISAINIAKMNKWNYVLVFEDDIELNVTPEEFNDSINTALDTPYYARFKPLEFENNNDRKYYWKRDKLVEEGIRRSQDDTAEIEQIQSQFDNEINYKKKNILQDELKLFKWRSNIFELKDKNTGISREKRDIISDYYPEEIGLQRHWIERHSHIPNYSY